MIGWISYIGSFVGLLTGIFVVYDRLLAQRPVLMLTRVDAAGQKMVTLRVRNPSSEDILVEVGPSEGSSQPVVHFDARSDSPTAPFEVLVPSRDAREFPLRGISDADWRSASRVRFTVRWTRVRSTRLPQWPCTLTTTTARLLEVQRAL